jgi:glycerol kinase
VKVLPALSGLGAPWWNPHARGVISGLSAATERAHVARAAIEAICQRVCDVLDAMSCFVEIEELRVDGGLAQSDLVPQLLADLAQVPVELGAVDATALGAAALAAVGAGVLGSIEEIADLVPPERMFTPRSVADERTAWREFVARAAKLSGP